MAVSANLVLDSGFLDYAVTNLLAGENLRLGVILSGSEVAPGSSPATAIAAEYAGFGWTRPSIVLASSGSYNAVTGKWEIPATTEWAVVGPSGGFAIKQVFVIVGGSTTPLDTTGTFLGLATYSTAISVDSGATQPIRAPWRLYGVS